MHMDKDKMTKTLLGKYRKIFKDADKEKKIFIEKLYTEAVFMEITLMELKEKIKEEGAITTGTNGNGFEVTQEHPATKSYNTMIRNYNGIMKTILENVPEDTKDDELMLFIGKGKQK